jgi:sugar phosphate permease
MYVRAVSGARYRWVVLGVGTFAQASFSASTVGLPALGPALKSHYALTLGETGVVLAATGIGMLFTLLPWGLVADRVDERWVIATGLSAAAGSLALASATRSFGAVTAALVATGALGASVNAASGRAIMAWFPR